MPMPFDNEPNIFDSPPPQRQQPSQPKSSWSVLKILLILAACGFVVFVSCAGFVGYHVYMAYKAVQDEAEGIAEQSNSGEEAFEVANRLIIGNSGGTVHGNTAEALQLAEKFSTEIHTLREAFFTKRKKEPKFSLTKGEFLTYCRLDENACVFLVHVPDLRKFTDDAKSSLADLAWATAQSVVRSGTGKPPLQIAVGIRGVLLYDTVLIGDYVADENSEDDGVIIRESGNSSRELLYDFFAGDVAGPMEEVATPPTGDETPKSEQPEGAEKPPEAGGETQKPEAVEPNDP